MPTLLQPLKLRPLSFHTEYGFLRDEARQAMSKWLIKLCSELRKMIRRRTRRVTGKERAPFLTKYSGKNYLIKWQPSNH